MGHPLCGKFGGSRPKLFNGCCWMTKSWPLSPAKPVNNLIRRFIEQRTRIRPRRTVFLVCLVLRFAMSIAFAEVHRPDTSAKPCGPEVVGTASNFIYPLKASRNNRYLTDQNGAPFLLIGDAPQTLIANLSEADASKYMANRRKYGINTLWINLLCNYSDG